MDLSLVADPVTALGFSKFTSTNHPSDQYSTASAVLQISAAIYNSIAPPVTKNSRKTGRRSMVKPKRRTKKTFSDDDSSGDSGDGEDFGSFGGDDGGGFLGGGGGRGWNYDGFGGHSWDDDEFWFPYSSPAAYWFQDVFIWIVVGACLHFAIQRVVRIMSDGIGDAENEKVPRLC